MQIVSCEILNSISIYIVICVIHEKNIFYTNSCVDWILAVLYICCCSNSDVVFININQMKINIFAMYLEPVFNFHIDFF